MDTPLICSSTRRRPDWASLLPTILRDEVLRWKEASLETHDVAMPITAPGQGTALAFRAIFLTPPEIDSQDARKRCERLFHINGGQCIAIVLLMKVHKQYSNAAMLMRLQIGLLEGLEMPIIPVASVEAVPATLLAFHHQLCSVAPSRKRPEPARSLLPHCSHNRILSEHVVNLLSDITTDWKDLINHVTSSEGQQRLEEYLGEDAERVINFWKDEYLVE